MVAFFFSAHRFSIASNICFLPAAVMLPLRFVPVIIGEGFVSLELRKGHRAFIACDSRFVTAGVIPLTRFGEAALPFVRRGELARPALSMSALKALPIHSRSLSTLKLFCLGPIGISFAVSI